MDFTEAVESCEPSTLNAAQFFKSRFSCAWACWCLIWGQKSSRLSSLLTIHWSPLSSGVNASFNHWFTKLIGLTLKVNIPASKSLRLKIQDIVGCIGPFPTASILYFGCRTFRSPTSHNRLCYSLMSNLQIQLLKSFIGPRQRVAPVSIFIYHIIS